MPALSRTNSLIHHSPERESEPCCHPSEPIQCARHKSARRLGSSGSGKMECDGLVFTNSRGAPLLRQASHHSPHSIESSSSSHSICFFHMRLNPPAPPKHPPRFIAGSSPAKAYPLYVSSSCPPLSSHQRFRLTYIAVIKSIPHPKFFSFLPCMTSSLAVKY